MRGWPIFPGLAGYEWEKCQGDRDMRGIRALAAVAALVAMGQPALAATSLCAADLSTGFNWRDGRWVQQNFYTEQFLVRKIAVDDPMALACATEMAADGQSPEPVKSGAYSSAVGCYAVYDVGSEPTPGTVMRCEELILEDGTINSADCKYDIFTYLRFETSGNFVITRTHAAFWGTRQDGSRDSMALTVGKCSLIQ